MRIVLTPYSVAAFVLVLAGAAALAGTADRLLAWAGRLVRTAPVAGAVGLAATLALAGNALAPRTCAGGVRNRPLLSALTGDACRSQALVQLALVVVVAVATTAVVRALGGARPSATANDRRRMSHG